MSPGRTALVQALLMAVAVVATVLLIVSALERVFPGREYAEFRAFAAGLGGYLTARGARGLLRRESRRVNKKEFARMSTEQLERRVLNLVRAVKADPPSFGVLSTGEKCAVALVLDDIALMRCWGSALDCMYRLDSAWLQACINVQRNKGF